jgi:hypothetical protein
MGEEVGGRVLRAGVFFAQCSQFGMLIGRKSKLGSIPSSSQTPQTHSTYSCFAVENAMTTY